MAYRLIPVGVCVWYKITESIESLWRFHGLSADGSRFSLGLCNGLGLSWRSGWSSRLGLAIQRSNLKRLLVLLEDAFIVVLPELF